MAVSKEWTQAKLNSTIKSALRAASRYYPPRYETLKDSYVDVRINKASGRMAKHHKCAMCNGAFPSKDVQVDHIAPIIDPVVGFVSWDEVVRRMFCKKQNLQVLCKACHLVKTNAEKQLKKESKANDKRI